MCGIAGILSFHEQVAFASIEKMIATLQHRGPDGEGIWLNDKKNIGLGHRRLSIIDLSDTGKQPMHFANNRYTITFNGEIYNYLELKTELEKKEYRFVSSSDTEVILALFDLKREKLLEDLDGMFAFCIWDNHSNTLFCARDRFGEKPFFYHCNTDYFAFASEMKALFELGITNTINRKKVYDYLLYATLEDPYDKSTTFYESIKQLEPSHYMIVSADRTITKKQYWNLELNKTSDISEKEAIAKFRNLFTSSIERRLRSDVPVGSSLSGGLDSSSIVMMIDHIKKKNAVQKTFSARFLNFDRDEGKYMQYVIDRTHVEPHFVFPTVDSVMQNFKTICYHQEEPFASASIAIQFEVMKLAKQNGVTVLLDGQGADEMLAGYLLFWNSYLNQLYGNNRKAFRTNLDDYIRVHAKTPIVNDFLFKWKAYHAESFKAITVLKNKFKSPSSSHYLGIHPDLITPYKNDYNPIPKVTSLKEHLHFFLTGRGLNELLRYADRNAMANSVEVRLPFLNHTLVEFLFQLPDHFLLNQGWSKYILRKSMEDILPPEITWRKDKIGFEPPQSEWINTPAFKDLLHQAIIHLKKEKIINAPNPALNWQYISLFAFDSAR